jgi:hypothetical protein
MGRKKWKWLLVGAWFAVGLAILLVSIWRQGEQQLSARLYPPSAEGIPGAEILVAENYSLPEPGILPSNPLYFLKVAVERLHLVLIDEPELRAIVQLSYADRRLAAAQQLYEQGERPLAVETTVKAEGYLLAAIESAAEDKADEWLRRAVRRARTYHLSVVAAMREGSEGTLKQTLTDVYTRLENASCDF